ncbi:MAG: hypothetical protein MUF22_07115, partial [Chitinispirillaceae bacterium]|nr:hypothetical protein [Chitinispirillaceae bacterium]
MTSRMFYSVLTILWLSLQPSWSTVMITPLQIDQLDSTSAATINELFFEFYQVFVPGADITIDKNARCRDKTCAIDIGKNSQAQEVVYGVARKLGGKWIVSGWRINVADGALLASNRLDSKSLEDFEFVVKRMAQGLAKGKKVEETATVDNITESEMDEDQFRRREGFYAFGFKSGFLFPRNSTYYQRYENRYYYDSGYQNKPKSYSQVLNTDFVNWFELPQNLALEWDLHVGWMNEIGTHFSLLRYFSRNDFSPFVGGGIGLDYVFPDDASAVSADPNLQDKRNGGFTINGKAGMMLFRTYSFRIFANA